MSIRRKFYSGKDLYRVLSIDELRAIAAARVPNFAFEYVEGGSDDEVTLRRNREVFESVRLVPKMLVDTSARHQRVSLFGAENKSPLIVAPTGLNGMLWKDGDLALARAAAAAGIPFTLSSVSNVRLERVAQEAQGRNWMQLYVLKDRGIARDVIARAERAGYEALVFTTDANVFGNREWDRRNYRGVGKLSLRNLFDVAMHPRWAFDVVFPRAPLFENIIEYLPPEGRTARNGVLSIPKLFSQDISWADVDWIRKLWPRKLLLKGVLSAADAKRAAESGCDGIVVTNHGGRQLDSCVTSLEVLPEIAAEVGKRMSIVVDSGFRRGTDVVKALALGAHAVMIGRATLYGLAAFGEPGVKRALQILTSEIDRTLGQLGVTSISELGPHLIMRE